MFLFFKAIDDDCNQTGQMAAAFLNWPQVSQLIGFSQNKVWVSIHFLEVVPDWLGQWFFVVNVLPELKK
jgi:hypothetical protein